jgi:hypothetical protein
MAALNLVELNRLVSRCGGISALADLNVIDHLLATSIFLRDADCFFAVLRGIYGAGQFNTLVGRVHGYAREIRILLNLALQVRAAAHIALRHSRSGTAALGSR